MDAVRMAIRALQLYKTGQQVYGQLTRLVPEEDLLGAVGLRRRSGAPWGPTALAFGGGLVLGAGAALLLTPTSGPALRRMLREKAERLFDETFTGESAADNSTVDVSAAHRREADRQDGP